VCVRACVYCVCTPLSLSRSLSLSRTHIHTPTQVVMPEWGGATEYRPTEISTQAKNKIKLKKGNRTTKNSTQAQIRLNKSKKEHRTTEISRQAQVIKKTVNK
jgi:hypothetical protein